MAIQLTRPKLSSRPPVDPVEVFERSDKAFREKKALAEARLADLVGQAGEIEWSDLPPAEKARKLAALDVDRAQARLDLLNSTEAIASADTRRKLAYRASAEAALPIIATERRDVWTAARAELDQAKAALVTLNAAAAELTRLSDLDRALAQQARNECAKGGITRDQPDQLGAGIGVFTTAALEWSLGASDASLTQARQGRFGSN